MDLRPHKRLVIPFEPPHFQDLISVSECVAECSDRFGIAKFSADLFSYTTVDVLRRMCDSLGLRLMIDCSATDDPGLILSEADFVVVSISRIGSPVSPRTRRLVKVSGQADAIVASLHPVSGIACDGSFVAEAKSGLHGDPVILSLSGDPASAVRDGATMAVVDVADLLGSKDKTMFLRDLAEDVRKHT